MSSAANALAVSCAAIFRDFSRPTMDGQIAFCRVASYLIG
jgi:hypothetical protein